MRECHTDLLCDQPIFVTQSSRRRCAWLSKFFRAEDHHSGLARSVECHHSVEGCVNS